MTMSKNLETLNREVITVESLGKPTINSLYEKTEGIPLEG